MAAGVCALQAVCGGSGVWLSVHPISGRGGGLAHRAETEREALFLTGGICAGKLRSPPRPGICLGGERQITPDRDERQAAHHAQRSVHQAERGGARGAE